MPTIGSPLPLSRADLEALSAVSPLDIEAARALWVSSVPARWKSLLDSQTVSPGASLTTPFVWDASSRRYIELRTRRYVPFMEIRNQAIEPLIRSAKSSARALGAGLQETGRLAEWERAMIEQVKTAQIAAGLASNGGVSSVSEDDKEEIAALILLLLLFLRVFALEIASRKQAIDGRLLLRSDLYGAAARDTFEETRRFGIATYLGARDVQERRRLGRAEHCESDEELEGCIELADLGWQPINSLPRLGDTPCRTNCRCHFEYRYKNDRGEWILVNDSAGSADILRRLGVKERIE